MSEHKMEVIYYEMVKMEERLTQKAELILQAESNIKEALLKFEILQKELLKSMDEKK